MLLPPVDTKVLKVSQAATTDANVLIIPDQSPPF